MKYFISGIDTDSGKTVVVGLMARYLLGKGENVITQKMVQTGCENISEDIVVHRKIMGISLLPEDLSGNTCSYLFKLPASPHLSARLENVLIHPKKISQVTNNLSKIYDLILIEAAGGLMVPLNEDTLTIDYFKEQNHPVFLVSSSKLGSINHTFLSLEAIKSRGIKLAGLIYNRFLDDSPFITEDTELMLKKYLQTYFPNTPFISIPKIDLNNPEMINFESLFKNRI